MIKGLKNLFNIFIFLIVILTILISFLAMILDMNSMKVSLNEGFVPTYESNLVNFRNVSLSNEPRVIFCNESSPCLNNFIDFLNKAHSEILCSFYDLKNKEIIDTLDKKSNYLNISLILDNRNLNRKELKKLNFNKIKLYSDINRNTVYDNYIHHKFCIVDNSLLLTGSANPTNNGLLKNDNLIFIINSSELASNYVNEFNQLASGIYGYNKIPNRNFHKINFSYKNTSFILESYMCPQNNCEEVITTILDNAEIEILFVSYVLTQDEIEDIFMQRNNEIIIRGVIEKKLVEVKSSEVLNLMNYIDILLYTKSNNMHHKFFVIDEKIVIFGSLNPSNSGTSFNDENMIIIRSNSVAKLFKKEFNRLYYNG